SRLPIRFPHPHDAAPAALGRIRTDGGPKQGHGSENFSGLTYTLDNRRRLEVTPGLTCIWQVSGRSEIPFDEQCRMDVRYIEEQSVMADLRLLLKTIPAVITGRGAY
ncbi:sugar transferase, partial [Malikia spinosa]